MGGPPQRDIHGTCSTIPELQGIDGSYQQEASRSGRSGFRVFKAGWPVSGTDGICDNLVRQDVVPERDRSHRTVEELEIFTESDFSKKN